MTLAARISTLGPAWLLLACASSSSPGSASEAKNVATGLALTPTAMASDGATLYWITAQGDAIQSISVNGGTPSDVLRESTGSTFLAPNGSDIYFVANSQIRRVSKSGGASNNVLEDQRVLVATSIANTLYWVSGGGSEKLLFWSMPFGGNTPFKVAETGYPGVKTLAATSSNLFATVGNAPVVFAASGSDGGAPVVINGFCTTLVADEGAAYCDLRRIANDGTITLLSEATPTAIATDGTNLYFSTTSPAEFKKIPVGGGSPTVLAREEARAIALDIGSVYWATSDGVIRRMPK